MHANASITEFRTSVHQAACYLPSKDGTIIIMSSKARIFFSKSKKDICKNVDILICNFDCEDSKVMEMVIQGQ